MIPQTETVTDFYGRKLGTITTEYTGIRTARNFYGLILGRYNPREDKTRDFYGRVLCSGDNTRGLIIENNNKTTL